MIDLSLTYCSLRAVYGTDDQRNALHGSDSYTSAEREIRFFFPDSKSLNQQANQPFSTV